MRRDVASVSWSPLPGADPPVVRCWMCGAQPLTIYEVTTLSDPYPTYVAGRWPPGDHEHAVTPPSPSELLERGDRAVARILAIAAE